MAVGRTFMAHGLDLGPAANGDPRKFNETELPGVGGNTGGSLGQIFEKDGRFYRLVKIDAADTVDYLDGGLAYWKTKLTAGSEYIVTADASDGEALANGLAGGVHVVVDVSEVSSGYIFVQCGGDQAAVVVAASAVAGDHGTGHASTDNVLTRTAAGTAPVDLPYGTILSTRGTTTSDNGASVANSSKVRWNLGLFL